MSSCITDKMVITEYSWQHLLSFYPCIHLITPERANSRCSRESIVDQIFNTTDTVGHPTIQWFTILGTPKPNADLLYKYR